MWLIVINPVSMASAMVQISVPVIQDIFLMKQHSTYVSHIALKVVLMAFVLHPTFVFANMDTLKLVSKVDNNVLQFKRQNKKNK